MTASDRKTKVSLQTIADRLGVSKMTVSLALRGSGEISRARAEKIRRVAARLGYTPDPLIAAGMAQIRRHPARRIKSNLAFLTVSARARLLDTSFAFRDFYDGASRRAAEQGYGLESHWLGDPACPPRRLKEILLARGIHGLVILHLDDHPADWPSLRFDFTPFACATVGGRLPGLHCAMTDHYHLVHEALRHCQRLGCRRAAIALPPDIDQTVEQRLSHAYFGAMRGHHPLPVLFTKTYHTADNLAHVTGYVERHRPDVVLGFLDHESVACLTRGGVRYLGLDCAPSAHQSGMEQRHREVAAAAVDLVTAQLHRREYGPATVTKTVLIEAVWRERDGGTEKNWQCFSV